MPKNEARLRPGIAASAMVTLALSLGAGYLSLSIVKEEFMLSVLGIVTSVLLIFLSIKMLRGDKLAVLVVASFYAVLAILGLFIAPSLPSEGMLTFVFSAALSYYLLRHRGDPLIPKEISEIPTPFFDEEVYPSEEPPEEEQSSYVGTNEDGLTIE